MARCLLFWLDGQVIRDGHLKILEKLLLDWNTGLLPTIIREMLLGRNHTLAGRAALGMRADGHPHAPPCTAPPPHCRPSR